MLRRSRVKRERSPKPWSKAQCAALAKVERNVDRFARELEKSTRVTRERLHVPFTV